MTSREYLKVQVDTLPEQVIEKILEFVSFQKFNLGFEDETDYLKSVPGMENKINNALMESVSVGIPMAEVWADV